MAVKYPFLEGKIAERGVRKNVIAKKIGISPRTFSNKLSGRTSFTWDEANTIQREFFPDVSKDELFENQAKGERA